MTVILIFCIYFKEPYNNTQPLIVIFKKPIFLILGCHAINLPKKCASWIFQWMPQESYVQWAALLNHKGCWKIAQHRVITLLAHILKFGK